MIFLDEARVKQLLTMGELIPAMANALAALSAGRAQQPVRTVIPVDDHRGFFGSMPAYDGSALGAKLVTFYPGNRDVDTHHGLIAMFAPETGEPIAVLDGRLITEMRTAAVSAVATKLLARTDAGVLALIGAGVQARSHLEAIGLVRKISEVRVWSPHRAAAFADENGVSLAASPQDAVRGADIVVVATTSREPVLFEKWLAPGTHVNAVGANRPEWRELDDNTMRVSRTFVESRASAVVESGDLISGGVIAAEIGEVVERPDLGRQTYEEITLFKSLGYAVEDIAAAHLVLQKLSE